MDIKREIRHVIKYKNLILHHIHLNWALNSDFRADTINRVVRFKQDFYKKTFIEHFVKEIAQAFSKP